MIKIPIIDNRRISDYINDYTDYLHGRAEEPDLDRLPRRLRSEARGCARVARALKGVSDASQRRP